MKKDKTAADRLQRCLQCYGEFTVQDPVCRQVCALRIRCAVESSRQDRMEVLEELFGQDEVRDRMH